MNDDCFEELVSQGQEKNNSVMCGQEKSVLKSEMQSMFLSQKERAIEWERLKIHKAGHSEPEGARPQKRMMISQKTGDQTPLNKNGGKDI